MGFRVSGIQPNGSLIRLNRFIPAVQLAHDLTEGELRLRQLRCQFQRLLYLDQGLIQLALAQQDLAQTNQGNG